MMREPKREEPDVATMDAAVKALGRAVGCKNVVKVYRITEEYQDGQMGYEGLEFVEERDVQVRSKFGF